MDTAATIRSTATTTPTTMRTMSMVESNPGRGTSEGTSSPEVVVSPDDGDDNEGVGVGVLMLLG